jgi:zinc and cadmium transporter
MSEVVTLGAYAGAILMGSVAGGALPLLGRMERSDALLSFSAGVMLGAAFLHMLPEAVAGAGMSAMPVVLGGFLFLFLVERLVLVHVCAEPGPSPRLLAHPPPPPEDVRSHPGHEHAHEATGCDVHTLGLAAVVGLSLHTLVDGFALGAANTEPSLGLLVFLAILAHKIPSSFSLSAILRAEGYRRGRALLMNASFALMVPASTCSCASWSTPSGSRRWPWRPAPAPSSTWRSRTSCPTCTAAAAPSGSSPWRSSPAWR